VKRVLLLMAGILAAGALLVSCVAPAPQAAVPAKGPITVGSKLDLEGQLLGEMIILALRDRGFKVTDVTAFGATSVVRKALESGELDIYPEYTGNGAFFFDEAGDQVWKDLETGWQRVKQLDQAAYGIVWLRPAPVTNDWAIALPRTFASQQNLVTLEDFAAYVNGDGYVKLIGSEEFVTSEAALPNFQTAYGFTLTKDQLVSVAGGDTTQTEKAAAEGTDGINATMAYSTDGGLAAFDLVILKDNKGVNPIYAPAPRARGEVINKYPELGDILNPVFESLNLETLQSLNEKTAVEGQVPAVVAGGYLKEQGFLK